MIPILMLSGTQVEKVGNVKTVKEPKKQTNKYYAMKLSQIRLRLELCMREIILRFVMNLILNDTQFAQASDSGSIEILQFD
jgi:hypothetical protein